MTNLLTENLEYACDSNAGYKITEVALRHGLDSKIGDEFRQYVEDCIETCLQYRSWESNVDGR